MRLYKYRTVREFLNDNDEMYTKAFDAGEQWPIPMKHSRMFLQQDLSLRRWLAVIFEIGVVYEKDMIYLKRLNGGDQIKMELVMLSQQEQGL